MISSIIKFIAITCNNNLPLINIILSIIPFLGSKVSIPYTTNYEIWQNITLSPLHSFLLSAAANIGLIIIIAPLFSIIIFLFKKYCPLRLKTKKTKVRMPALEKVTIFTIIKSFPLVGTYLSVFLDAFYLTWWQNLIANIVGTIIACLISTLININTPCKIIVFLVISLEMLALTIITIVHLLRNTPPLKTKNTTIKKSKSMS